MAGAMVLNTAHTLLTGMCFKAKPRSVIRITPLSLLTLNSISLVFLSSPSAYACYASGAVLVRD